MRIPVIASGGAGRPEHLYDVLTEGQADAALVASMVHEAIKSFGDDPPRRIQKVRFAPKTGEVFE